MTTVQEIEDAIAQLSENELDILREWFDHFDAERWDEQFESDVKAGKLDDLANQAKADFRAGKYSSRRDGRGFTLVLDWHTCRIQQINRVTFRQSSRPLTIQTTA